MANPEHLEILNQGIERWNQWRKKNPYIQPNLSETNLSEFNLSEANLNKADLRLTNLSEADLRNAILSHAVLSEADLRHANLSGADFRMANLERAEMTYVNLANAVLSEAKLYRCDLSRADLCKSDLSQADLGWANLSRANLSEANLTKADMRDSNLFKANLFRTRLNWANLSKAYLLRAYLYGSNLFGATLTETNLVEADLSFADLRWSDLTHADLTGAILSTADLSYASLHETNLHQINLTNARICETSFNQTRLENCLFTGLDLSVAKNLDTCIHYGPSILDYRALFKSIHVPKNFLAGCGVPEVILQAIEDMENRSVIHHPCYISFSRQDEEIARIIHKNLQYHDIRCWLSPEDKKHGDKVFQRIEETIQWDEKLLVIFSEHIMNNSWIRQEIEAVFKKEGEMNRNILIPVCVDNSFLVSKDSLLTDVRKSRPYHQFIPWNDTTVFQSSFHELLAQLVKNSDPTLA